MKPLTSLVARLLFTAAVILAAAIAPVFAEEPSEAFLDGLRQRGYYDVALDYLDAAAESPVVSKRFKETVLYEKGLILVQSAKEQRDPQVRERQIDEAQKMIEEFLVAQPYSVMAGAARSQLGTILAERARVRVEKSKRLAGTEKQTVLKEARSLYEQAAQVFEKLSSEYAEKLKGYPAAMDEKKDARRIEERDRLRKDHLYVQMLVPATYEEMAETSEKGSKERTDTLIQAETKYRELFEKYRTRTAGMYARIYQGRCIFKLGRPKDASAIYNELLANPDTPDEFRTVKRRVMPLAVESWFEQQLYLEIVNKAIPIIDDSRPGEDKTDDIMGMRLTVAKACKAYAEDLRKSNPPDPQAKLMLAEGRKQVTFVARNEGTFQEVARKLLPEFTDSGDAPERPEPRTFAEARTAAKEAIEAAQTANLLVKTIPGKLAAEKDAAAIADLQKQLSSAQQQAAQAQSDAIRYCRLALGLVEPDTDLLDVNLVRYLLCYMLYSRGDLYEASVLGEFIATRYPDSQGARQCAKIAMASYLQLYGENKTNDKDFETRQLIDICEVIVNKWPNEPEAAEALNTLIPFMIREKKLKEAQDYLAKIPLDSPQRGTAELKTGQALWASYLDNSQLVRDWESGTTPLPAEGVDLPAKKQELERLKNDARETLIAGVERMRLVGEANKLMSTAVLFLAQIYVDTGEAAKAVQLLEDPQIGALTLVRAGDSSTEIEGFAEETYKTALRAYISSLAGTTDGAAAIEKAKGAMQALEEHMGRTPDGQQQLVAIYVSLASDLQRQMEIAEPSVKVQLGEGFEVFLKEVAEDATEFNVLYWVAETYRGMGEAFGGNFQSLTPEAKGYLETAAASYQKILDLGQSDPTFLSPEMAIQIRMQLARTRRGLGDYVGAMNIFESMLRKTPTAIPVQIQAAHTYQDWANFGKPDLYLSAIQGARPDKPKGADKKPGPNIIWGWAVISRITAGKPQYKEHFLEARYNLCLSRYQYALAQKDAAKKKEALASAKRDIAVTTVFYTDLGGDKWRGQYEGLLKNVQKSLGEKPVGLAALEPVVSDPSGAGGASQPVSAPAAPTKKKATPTGAQAAPSKKAAATASK